MSETTVPTGGSNVLNDKKQQELYVKRCNDVFESMSKAGYKDVLLNIMEARIKDVVEKGKDTSTDNAGGEDSTANNDKKRETTLIIGGLPYKQVPFAPYIDLLKSPKDYIEKRVNKSREKEVEQNREEQNGQEL